MGPEDITYQTIYRYDEAGNRIFKLQYKYIVSTPPEGYEDSQPGDSLVVEQGDGNGYWVFQSKSFYVRDITGKEIAVYSGTSIEQWNIYGLDNVGKIDANNKRYFYLKDHLGSIRATLDTTNTVVSAQDYDCWGYPLENRSWQSGQSVNQRYKFTGKEHDNENNYDYFGARYFDSRIGRWGGVEPLLDRYINVSPYIYVFNNPILMFDVDGRGLGDGLNLWYNTKKDIENTLNDLQKNTEEFINNIESGDILGAVGNSVKAPIIALGLIPSDPMIDFIAPIGMVKQTPKLLKLSQGSTTKAISKFLDISDHAALRMLERNVTEDMVIKTLNNGNIFWDPKNKVFKF